MREDVLRDTRPQHPASLSDSRRRRLRSDWKLGSLHQDPEFIALLNELETDILEQRQWYEETKDKPHSVKIQALPP